MCKMEFIIIALFVTATSEIFKHEQIHLSFTQQENEIKVTWVSWQIVQPEVHYKPYICNLQVQNDDWSIAKASSKVFYPGSHKDWFYWIYSATMSNLNRSCLYHYRIIDDNNSSQIFNFSGRTPQVSQPFEDNNKPVRAWIYGDLGTGVFGQNSLDLLKEITDPGVIDAIFHLGDIAYDMDDDQGAVGDEFFNNIMPFAAQVPYMVALGTHDQGYRNKTHYMNRFNMPVNEANQGSNLFYSLNLGPVHFIVLNSVQFGFGESESGDELMTQYNWLMEDLKQASHNREHFPWIVVLSHLAMYCTPDWDHPDVYNEYVECLEEAHKFRNYCEELFIDHKVDFVFQGHVHNYERDSPIRRWESIQGQQDTFYHYVNPQAPIYIVTGNAGNHREHNDPISETDEEWTKFLSDQYGVGELIVYNKTHAYWQQYRSEDQRVIDFLYVTKKLFNEI